MLPRTSGKDMLFVDELFADGLLRDIKFNANHQSTTANLQYVGIVEGTNLLHQIVAYFTGIIDQMFRFHDVEHGQSCSASQVVAAEGRTQLSKDGLEVWSNEHSAHRKPISYALGHGNEVGTNTQMLMGKELAAASVTTLNLVAHKHGAIALTENLQLLGKIGFYQSDSTYALDALEHDSSHIALFQFALPSIDVVHGQVSDVSVAVDGCLYGWVVGGLYSQRCASVEGFLEGQDAGASCVERRQLQGILVGFCTTVDEEQTVVIVTREGTETARQFLLQGIDDAVGIEAQLSSLLCKCFDIMRMAVSDADDGMTAIEVEVLLAFVIPDVAALSARYGDVEKGIYVIEL